MKTVVLGLFDEIDDARRVLGQLASSPLDLSAIEVVRRDVASQLELARDAGLRSRRGPWAAIVAGALLGAMAGMLAGQGPLASLGPLLAMAAGLVVGALAGAALAGFSDTLRVPTEHADLMLEAVEAGATAVVVRTDNLPTARAIGDLFRACGSRELAPVGELEDAAETEAGTPTPAPDLEFAPAEFEPPPAAEKNAIFAPPWRRGVPQPESEPPPSAVPFARPSDAGAAQGSGSEATAGQSAEIPPAGAAGEIPGARVASPPLAEAPLTSPPLETRRGQPPPASIAPGPVRFEPLPPALGAAAMSKRSATARDAEDVQAPAAASPHGAATSSASSPGVDAAEPEGVTLADDADIIVLGLAARHARALRDAGIQSIGALTAALAEIEQGALAVPGIGPAGTRAIREQLDAAGVSGPTAAGAPGPSRDVEATDIRRLLHAAIRDIRSERE